MSTEQPIVFIVGGGPRIGHAVASKFAAEGYRVALGRQNIDASAGLQNVTPVTVDVTNIHSVEKAFMKVEEELGVPDVVIYNG